MTNQDHCKTYTEPSYKEYVDMCTLAEEPPMTFSEWQETNLSIQALSNQKPVNPKYHQHVNTAPNPLTEETFDRMQADVVETAAMAIMREGYEEQKAALWKPIEDTRKDNRAVRAELEEYMDTCRQLETELDEAVEANRTLVVESEGCKNSYIQLQMKGHGADVTDLERKLAKVVNERDTLLSQRTGLTQAYKDINGSLITLTEDKVTDLERELSEVTRQRDNIENLNNKLFDQNNEGWSKVHDLQQQLDTIGQRTTPANQPLYPHYFREVPLNTTHVDVYWVLKVWEVTDPCIQHAVKKLLAAGRRGAKNVEKDLTEAFEAVKRAIELS